MTAPVLLTLAAVLLLCGILGGRKVDSLVPYSIDAEERVRRRRVMRRGAVTCQVVGVVFAAAGALLLFRGPGG